MDLASQAGTVGGMALITAGRLADPDRTASGDFCPIERTLGVVGTRSAMVLLREAAYGTSRFDDFVRRTGLTEAVTATRLRELVADGLLTREPYREPGQRTRQAYVLTQAGRDLVPALLALAAWGTRHAPRRRSPTWTHDGCGEAVHVALECAAGHRVPDDELVVRA
jgi:DNA-binding HxlR family transcriptional regulator